jgi:spore coat protein U-like protein
MSPLRATLASLALAAAVLLPGMARAQSCTFTAGPTTLDFGAYDPTTAIPTDSSATLTYSCSSARSRPVLIDLDAGQYGTFTTRMMALGSDRLTYNLYTTTTRNVIWGDGTGSTSEVSSVPQGQTHGATVPIYGRVDMSQWVPAGTYTDTVVVTLNF